MACAISAAISAGGFGLMERDVSLGVRLHCGEAARLRFPGLLPGSIPSS